MGIKFLTIGSDPEVFLTYEGKGFSAEGMIGGSKDEPLMLTEEGHSLQEDNVMAEFNIPPVMDEERFVREINFTLDKLKERIDDSLDIAIVPSMEFNKEFLMTPQCFMSGCSKDYNAWKKGEENPTVELSSSNFRFAGGHIHVGYENLSVENTIKIVKAMDLFLGVPSVILDSDVRRKEIYGTAGRFRFTKYGLEYRSLSNFWLVNDDLIKWVFRNTIKAIDYVNNNDEIKDKTIMDIINNNNVKEAMRICKDLQILPSNASFSEKITETIV